MPELERKIGYAPRATHKRKFAGKPEPAGMTQDQMRVFGKFHETALRSLDNLACALVVEPSTEQAHEVSKLLDQLADRIEALYNRISGQGEE